MSWSRCDPNLRAWVERVVRTLGELLGSNHVGSYLHGSLAQGAFYPPKSDVDLLVVVRRPPTRAEKEAFWRACIGLSEVRPMTGDLECTVITSNIAADVPFPPPVAARVSETTSLEEAVGEPADLPDVVVAIQALRETGVTLDGAPIGEVFGTLAEGHFREAMAGDVDWILEGENIVLTPFYGVLNLCRALWVWTSGSSRLAPSKDEAGVWALEQLPEAQTVIVSEALAAYRDPAPVTPQTRRTANRDWDREGLLAFRDHFREIRRKEA
jgi:predicted nucleotidyltransferase